MDRDRAQAELKELFERYRSQGLFTHAAAAFGSLDRRAPTLTYDCLPDGRDVFDLASLTKALATTSLVFRDVVRDGLALDATLGDWLGDERSRDLDDRLRRLTVRSLLRHETGLPAWRNFWVCHLGVEPNDVLRDPVRNDQRLVEGFNRAAAAMTAERRSLYSDVGFLLLGLALTRRHGCGLAEQFEAFWADELGLGRDGPALTYGLRLEARQHAVPTAFCVLRGRTLCGEVHDENCASLGGSTGHAGLFGTTTATARFLHALQGSPVGKALLERNAEARVLPVGASPNDALAGWRQGSGQSAASFRAGGGMGHLGFTGTAFWVDPDRREYALLYTNRVCSGRVPPPEIVAFRRAVFGVMNALRA